MKLAPNQSVQFPIIEESQAQETFAVNNVDSDLIAIWTQNKAISVNGRQALDRIRAKQEEINSLNRDLESTTVQLNELITDQARVRQNLGSLNQLAGQEALVQKYARDLANQETNIAQLRDKSADLRKKKATSETDLNRLLFTLEF